MRAKDSTPFCSVEGCHRRARFRGVCPPHRGPRKTLDERFWAMVDKDGPTMPHMDTQCWMWTGYRVKNYGRIYRGGGVGERYWTSPRLAWTLANGPIPDGLMIRHRCDNPPCVRADHLLTGTAADNSRDAVERGLLIRGPVEDRSTIPRGERRGNVKLTDDLVRVMRARRAATGLRWSVLADEFGVSTMTAWKACTGKTWTHVV